MKCELCKKTIAEGVAAVPVGHVHNWGGQSEFSEIISASRGIHLTCLKEVVASLKTLLP